MDDKILHLEIDPSVEEEIKVAIEEILTIGTIIGKIIEIDQEAGGTVIGQVIGVVITHIITDEVIHNSRVSTNQDHMRCYRCREYDHFAAECPNTPTDKETDYEDADPASLQIMSQSYGPNDLEREGDYLNL